MRTWAPRLAVFVLGFVCLLLAAEVSLRTVAWVRHWSRAEKSTDVTKGTSTITILAVGESTTAPYFPGLDSKVDVSWPRKTEIRLNEFLEAAKSPYRVKVENLGVAGVSSAFLVEAVAKRLEEGPVDALVSMMGVNDAWAIIPETNFWYRSSYLVRLFYWAYETSLCPSCFREKPQELLPIPDLTDEQRNVYQAFRKELELNPLKSQSDLERLRSDFDRREIAMGPGAFQAMVLSGWDLLKRLRDFGDADPRRAMFRGEIERRFAQYRSQVLKTNNAVVLACYVELEGGTPCAPLADEAFDGGMVPSDALITLLLSVPVEHRPRFLEPLLKSRGLVIASDIGTLEGVRRNYRRLAELVKVHELKWFAMQYPTGTVAGLQWLMAKQLPADRDRFHQFFYDEKGPAVSEIDPVFNGVVLVSNQNFQERVQADGAEKYFRDYFARRAGMEFGHTTEAGYDLIAENLAAELLKKLNFHQAKERPTEP